MRTLSTDAVSGLKRALVHLARLYCLGDPNLRGQLRTLHTLRAVRGSRVSLIADAGCGRSGALGWYGGISFIAYPLSRMFRESRIVGYDRDDDVVRMNREAAAKANADNLSFSSGDLSQVQTNRKYDIVVFSDIARDARRDGDLIAAVARLVGPGGRLVIICPNRRQLVYSGAFERVATGSGFSRADLASALEASGLSVDEVRPMVGPLAGRAALAAKAAAAVHYLLLVFTFPFLMTLSFLDLWSFAAEGDGWIAVAAR